jgi:hypothetical protein
VRSELSTFAGPSTGGERLALVTKRDAAALGHEAQPAAEQALLHAHLEEIRVGNEVERVVEHRGHAPVGEHVPGHGLDPQHDLALEQVRAPVVVHFRRERARAGHERLATEGRGRERRGGDVGDEIS